MRLTIGETKVQIASAEDLPIATTYEVIDLLDPSKSKGAWSNPVEFPQTIGNRILADNDMSSPLKDRNRIPFKIDNGAGVLWSGKAVPDRIGKRLHEWSLIGDNATWFEQIGERELKDLDLGETPPLTRAAVIDSWNLSNGYKYMFPVVDYGNFTNKGATYNVDLSYILPAVNARAIFEHIINDIGYTPVFKGEMGARLDKSFFLFTGDKDKLKASQDQLDYRAATLVSASPPSSTIISGLDPNPVIDLTATNDPSGACTSLGLYVAAQDIRVDIRFTVGYTTANPYLHLGFKFYDTAYYFGTMGATSFNGPGTFTATWVIENMLLTEAHQYGAWVDILNGTVGTINSVKVEIIPRHTAWQELVSCKLSSAVPEMKQSEFIKGMIAAFCAVVETDLDKRTITFTPDPTWRKPAAQAIDWTRKLDVENSDPAKVRDTIPKYFEFRCEADDSDRHLVDFVNANGRGLGDHDYVVGDANAEGTQEINVPWAATRSGTYLGSIIGPQLINRNQTSSNVPSYDFTPRLVFFHGLIDRTWNLDGTDTFQVPEMHFVKPGSEYGDFSYAFGSNGGEWGNDAGLVDRLHYGRMTLIEYSRILEAELHLDDEDIRTLDFSRPVLIRVEGSKSAYYLLKVDQYLWGRNVSTPVRLIEAVSHAPLTRAKITSVPTPIRKPPRR